jgi:hypothetical protein
VSSSITFCGLSMERRELAFALSIIIFPFHSWFTYVLRLLLLLSYFVGWDLLLSLHLS